MGIEKIVSSESNNDAHKSIALRADIEALLSQLSDGSMQSQIGHAVRGD